MGSAVLGLGVRVRLQDSGLGTYLLAWLDTEQEACQLAIPSRAIGQSFEIVGGSCGHLAILCRHDVKPLPLVGICSAGSLVGGVRLGAGEFVTLPRAF